MGQDGHFYYPVTDSSLDLVSELGPNLAKSSESSFFCFWRTKIDKSLQGQRPQHSVAQHPSEAKGAALVGRLNPEISRILNARSSMAYHLFEIRSDWPKVRILGCFDWLWSTARVRDSSIRFVHGVCQPFFRIPGRW